MTAPKPMTREEIETLRLLLRDFGSGVMTEQVANVLCDMAEAYRASLPEATSGGGKDARRQGHSALRAKDGKIEQFDPHPAPTSAGGEPTVHVDGLCAGDRTPFVTKEDHDKYIDALLARPAAMTLARDREEAMVEQLVSERAEASDALASTLDRVTGEVALIHGILMNQAECPSVAEGDTLTVRHLKDLIHSHNNLAASAKK